MNKIVRVTVAAAGTISLVLGHTATACSSDKSGGPLTPTIVIVGDGEYKVSGLKAKKIKADSPGKSCLWWVWYDVKSQPGKGIILAKGDKDSASVNLGATYNVKGAHGKIRKFKPTSFTTDGCGRWIKR